MTFQDRKTTGKNWDKTKEKREELHKRNDIEANKPKSVFKQVDEELREQKKEEPNKS